MLYEYNDKGKFFTDVISKDPVASLVQTSQQLIRGIIHVRRGERLKDELDRDELFLAITDAQVLNRDGKVAHEADFIAVQRKQIIWIIPDEQADGGSAA